MKVVIKMDNKYKHLSLTCLPEIYTVYILSFVYCIADPFIHANPVYT